MANIFTSAVSKNVGTAVVTVYTVPALTSTTIIGLSMVNVSGGDASVDVYVTRGALDVYLGKAVILKSGGTYIPAGGDQKIVMIAGDQLKVRSSVVNSLDVVVSMMNNT